MSPTKSFFIFEIVVIVISLLMTPTVRGPYFIVYYITIWFALLFLSGKMKWKVLAPVLLFVSGGLTRFFVGRYYGMEKWDAFWGIFIVGIIIYLLIAVMSDGSGGGSGSGLFGGGFGFWDSGCSSGGCSGGGCSSGGGCGGCGGD